MTRELDPQLVEAVARGLHADAEDRYGIYGAYEELFNEGYDHFQDQAIAAITAADAHRAPAVREAVIGLMSAQGNLIAAYYVEMSVRIDVLRQERDNARTHLLNLLGAQEGDDA